MPSLCAAFSCARPRHRPSRPEAGQHRRARIRARRARLQGRRFRTRQPARNARDAPDRAARVPRDDRLASPEQLTGAVVDARSDIYSLGTVVFEMLTGRVPFGGPDAMAMLTAHLNATAPKLSETLADIPAWVDLAVSRALANQQDAGRRSPTSDMRCSPEMADRRR